MTTKTKLLIQGWRGISHSISLVNQNQILELCKDSSIEVFHEDVKYYMESWNSNDADSGFNQQEKDIIAKLPTIDPFDADAVYRIATPISEPQHKKTISFIVSEFGLRKKNFINPTANIEIYTQEQRLIATPSRWSRDRILDWGFSEAKIRVIPHGIRKDVFFPLTHEERIESKRNLGIPDDHLVYLNIGIPTWNKGIDLLIKAFCIICKKHKSRTLIIKDSNNLYGLSVQDTIKDIARQNPGLINNEVINNIKIISTSLNQSQLRTLYNVSDVYVSPYRAEGFNLPVIEALACGTHALATSGGPTDDFAKANTTKIPSTFVRRDLPDRPNSCYLDPYFDALVQYMDVSEPKSKSADYTYISEIETWYSISQKLINALKE